MKYFINVKRTHIYIMPEICVRRTPFKFKDIVQNTKVKEYWPIQSVNKN